MKNSRARNLSRSISYEGLTQGPKKICLPITTPQYTALSPLQTANRQRSLVQAVAKAQVLTRTTSPSPRIFSHLKPHFSTQSSKKAQGSANNQKRTSNSKKSSRSTRKWSSPKAKRLQSWKIWKVHWRKETSFWRNNWKQKRLKPQSLSNVWRSLTSLWVRWQAKVQSRETRTISK